MTLPPSGLKGELILLCIQLPQIATQPGQLSAFPLLIYGRPFDHFPRRARCMRFVFQILYVRIAPLLIVPFIIWSSVRLFNFL